MPYTVEVPGHGVVEVPDGVSLQQAQIEIEKAFPYTGEDIAGAMQDPSFTPTKSDYLKFEEYSKTKQVDWINTAAQAADAAIGMIGGAISEGAQGAAANPLNYIEGFAQGTRQLYGLAAQSQDPSSPLFKFKDLVAGTGTPESRYNQFLDARQFGITSARLERGEEGVWVPPEYTNPEYVQGVSMILDPTLFVPGVGEILGTGKLATRAVGKGAQLTGRAVAGVARPLERFAGAAERMTAEALGMTPEGLRTTAATAGIAGALGIAPEAAAFAAIPAGIRTAREASEALSRAGENLMNQPSRVGPLEAIGAAPGANLRQRMLGVIGQYGGDAAVDASLRGLAGGIEGGVIGTGLGYLSGGEEGAAAGLGSGGVQGVAGALGGRAYQKLTGAAAKEARAGDLGRFIDSQQDPTTKALFERLRDTHGVDAASGLMDLQGLVRGKLGDVEVEYLSNEDFTNRYKISARGVQVDDKGGRPAVVINADIIGKGKGDGPLYTLGHELFHALEKSTQLQGGATEIKNALVGRWIQEGDTIRKLSEGAFSDADIEARFNQYRDKLGAGNASMADELAQYDTINKKADYVASELAAEHFAGLLAGQKPDALLKGFTGLTRQLVDLALTQNASRALAEAAATIERTFGVKPTDSVLFPDLKQASPQVNAMLRDLLRARRKLDEKINIQNDKTKAVLKPEDVANPLAAKQLIELGLAEQMPDGTVRAMSTDEIVAREKKDQDSLNAIIENTPGNSRMVDGVALGRLSPNQLSAIEQSQTVSSRMKDKIRAINATMDAGTSLNITYSAALKKIVNRLTGKKVNRYSSGIRLSDRDMLPYSFYFSKAANPVVKAIDISKVRDAILKDTASNGSVGKGLWDNVDGFMGDLAKYFTNLDQKEGARRSAEIFGLEKAKYLGDFVGAAEKGESKFIRDFRLDRIGSMAPSGFRARFSEEAYQLSKQRWMPAEKLGDKSITNSEEGYRIISGAKHKLYRTDGKLIGIYDTQTQAERKADATQERLQPEVRQQQRPLRDEGRQATEAGGRNRAVGGQEGQGQGGAVRQEGDVVRVPDETVEPGTLAPDSGVDQIPMKGTPIRWDTAPETSQLRFMPEIDRNAFPTMDQSLFDRLKEQTGTLAAIHIDRLRVGKYKNVDLQGGMFYPAIKENRAKGVVWAFNSTGVARAVAKRALDNNGFVKLVLMQEGNVIGNKTFTHIWFNDLKENIQNGLVSKTAALRELNAIRSKFEKHANDKLATGHTKSWKTLDEAFNDIVSMPQQKRASTYFQKSKTETKAEGEKIAYQSLLSKKMTEAGFPDAIKIVEAIEEPAFKGVPSGAAVGIIQIDPISTDSPILTGKEAGVPEHLSYEYVLKGKPVGKMEFYSVVEQIAPETKGKMMSQAQVNFPIEKSIPQAAEAAGQLRFMPNQQGFYSKLEEVVNAKIPKVASPQQVLASVDPGKGSGVKPEELKWTGFAQAVERIANENGGKVPKDKLIEHLNNEGSVKFEEVTLGTVWNVGDSNHTERYTNLKDALSAKEDVIDFLKGELERGWSVEEQDDGFVVVDEYGDRIGEQRSDSGRVVWKPSVYRSEAEAESAIKEGAKDLAESYVVFNENQVQGSAIHADYQLPGGENYREVVLTSDTSKPYTSSHYTDIENYVAHMRLNDRTANDGRNGLFIEEIQSDRHQQSRERGYGTDWSKVPVYKYSDLVSKGVFPTEMHIESKPGAYSLVSADGATLETSSSIEKLKSEYDKNIGSIPDAPFRKDWSLQMFKRALRDAVSSDKKWIGWTTGDTQAARYDLSKQVDYIDYRMAGPDKYDVSVVGKNGTDLFSESGINQSRVSDVVGKEIADKMSKGEGQSGGGRMTLRGVDLQVGGEGMKGFYDKILPSEVQKYVKQWKGEVTKSNIPESEIWRVDITPQMRESITKIGQARFMPDYSGEHKAPQRNYGAPLDNLKGVYPDDIYGPNAARYYGHSSGDATDKAAARIIQSTKGKPDAPVKVFRAIPKGIQSNEINPGDWITTMKSYAVQHGEGALGGDYKILEKTVNAGDLYTNGDSIFEFGYDPKFLPSPDSAMPGAYSFPGGYRAIPGKAKGSLRLYGPAGSLIGIASSLDEAQRILRRKNK